MPAVIACITLLSRHCSEWHKRGKGSKKFDFPPEKNKMKISEKKLNKVFDLVCVILGIQL